jgi:hypothetical protein
MRNAGFPRRTSGNFPLLAENFISVSAFPGRVNNSLT